MCGGDELGTLTYDSTHTICYKANILCHSKTLCHFSIFDLQSLCMNCLGSVMNGVRKVQKICPSHHRTELPLITC